MYKKQILENFIGKKIVVTGGAGTVGGEIVKLLSTVDVSEVRILDNNETALYDVELNYFDTPNFRTFLCDISHEGVLKDLFHNMDYVIHSAALKHVPFCEVMPAEAINTNILGVQSVINAARAANVKKVMFTSSDKAVNPTNVMGTSKLMGERLITAANALTVDGAQTIYASTRFGNVAGSAGSVVPTFCKQIANGGPITLTDRDMSRYIMSLEQSALLVLEALTLVKGGEVFVTKMPVVNIADLTEVMIEEISPLYGRDPKDIEIRIIGSRPGEKMFEELNTDEEIRRTFELEDLLVVTPAARNIYSSFEYTYDGREPKPVDRVFNSSNEELMTKAEIREFLKLPNVLKEELRQRLL
ncbi:polysaccharide biosynthesis protein [Sneathiella limimaris]|uniref:polysaccharide biosynthesis protein n=1 Tax=Sneathiella limimaris TaxID=1964213 RepID=UPI00146E9DC7|nr:polysaccharide biosynthesis protein [Sneathiella limimaris]